MAGLSGVSGSAGPAGPELVADALGQVYSAYFDRLMGFFVRRTRDRLLAEDLTHDVLLRFVESGSHDGVRPVWPYMKSIAANVLVDHLRRDSREVLDGTQTWEAGPADDAEIEDDLLLRDLMGSVIGGLPERQQVAVELRYGRAWTVGEAADLLGISVGTCRQLLFRARRNLKAALEQSGSRVHGVVAPALVGFRARWRSASARLRELIQAPALAASIDATASVIAAISIGLATLISAGTAAERPTATSWVPSTAAAAVGGSSAPVADDASSLADASHVSTTPPTEPERPSSQSGTRLPAPQSPVAGVETEGQVLVDEDEDRFYIRHDLVVRVGDDPVISGEGDDLWIECGGLLGDVVCSEDEDPTPW